MDNNWCSLHIYTRDFDLVSPLVKYVYNSLGEDFYKDSFFIRYWLGGPHLRLRFKGEDNKFKVFSAVEKFVKNHKSTYINKDEYYENYKYYSDSKDLPFYNYGDVIETPYERELNRYGGNKAIYACEDFFCLDSENLFSAINEGYDNELIMLLYTIKYIEVANNHGLNGMSLVDIEGIAPKDSGWNYAINQVDRKYSENKSDYFSAVEGGYDLPLINGLDGFLGSLIQRLMELNVNYIEEILNSLLHMSFNRIGVSPLKEGVIRRFSKNIIEDGYEFSKNKN
ncbi:hypothetical protein JF50_20290 [Pseudoalteromonas luteoviolacea]|uniref:Thiopeptide-type bacteriocin biosynthesis domain-containing protein n=1 Tax=Pseudoalteromonas luteoviolacea TaxID=43657 RepID=A0A0C1MM60_9GAMM|nr:thiopeptide-type bacteriocin biosynthesis protein [Pseudoalteromonas luteoviolacea]KID55548.1 hypothetical protein JF50_20290 [Pseudoalteromonas luteoviolacea]